MKKIIYLLMMAMTLLVSCEGDRGPMGPPGEKGEKGDATWWYVREFTVHSDQWNLVGREHDLNSYYEYEMKISDLDEDVFLDGVMTAYMYLDEKFTIQAQLPEVVHCGEISNGKEHLWTETYKCDFAVGSVMFKVEFSDFLTEYRPSTKRFRVVLQLPY
jgi:hypothetical protein